MDMAARLAASEGAEVTTFRHNDLADLERKMSRYSRERVKVIAVDGVYSMAGEPAPLPELAALAKAYNARVYVDDATAWG